MKTDTGSNNDDDPQRPMREALQGDAAKTKDAPFNAQLHYETMRRIRALAEKKETNVRWSWIAAAAGACACAVLVATLFPGSPKTEEPAPHAVTTNGSPAPSLPATASAWTYTAAARQGDEALLAMLDRDAQRLLPPTAPAFSTPLN